MAVLVIFEAIFAYVRQFLIVHLTTRVDVKLATYMFEKLLNLPIDFFERTQTGKITHDMNQMWKIRTFLMGQLFGTVLDSTTLLVFLPVMFFFSPIMTLIVLAVCALMVRWIVVMLPAYRRKSNAVEAAESERGAFLVQTIHGIRTVKSLALDARQRHLWDVLTARVAKLRFAEGMIGNFIQAGVRPLERFAVSGSYAVGVYLALTTNDPGLYRRAVRLPDAVAARVRAAVADGQADQPVRRGADCGRRCRPACQSAGGRRPFRPWRAHAD